VRVDDWAWPFVVESLESRHPDALVWPIVEGQDHDVAALKRASAAVYRALKVALEALPDLPQKYTVHDARHSYAVRHVTLGTSYQRIANNLGHVNVGQVIKVYGKFRLKDAEIEDAAPVAAPVTNSPRIERGA
jgi:integrase